jgi:hypothetical protein
MPSISRQRRIRFYLNATCSSSRGRAALRQERPLTTVGGWSIRGPIVPKCFTWKHFGTIDGRKKLTLASRGDCLLGGIFCPVWVEAVWLGLPERAHSDINSGDPAYQQSAANNQRTWRGDAAWNWPQLAIQRVSLFETASIAS